MLESAPRSALSRAGLLASLVAVAALGFGCSRKVDEPDPGAKPDPAKSSAVTAGANSGAVNAMPAKPGLPPAKGKLEMLDMKVGTGAEAKTGNTVKVHYTGTLTNGTKFDSSLDRNEPFSFTLGAGGVIKGWDEGVVGMKVGGKRKLTIPPDMGYGAMGSPPVIPANATLLFEIELLEVK
jgi:peptidylprolyl isomerase